MAIRIHLPLIAVKMIEKAVDQLFERAKHRVLGPQSVDKRIFAGHVKHDPTFTLPSLFMAAAREEYVGIPNEVVLRTLLGNAGNYIDSYRSSTKAQVVKAVDGWLKQAASEGVETNLDTVLQGELASVWKKTTTDLHRLVDTEASNARNSGVLDGIMKVNAAHGLEDPHVYFVIVRDQHVCEECVRLHMLPDKVTPRVWKMSELGHGYHKRGEDNPKIGGLHPHCRCSIVTLMPGYGFKDGFVSFIKPEHNEYERQQQAFGPPAAARQTRKRVKKSEEPLEKAIQWGHFATELARFGWSKPVMGNKHHEITNPESNLPGPRIQNMHWEKKLEPGAAEKYAKQIGLMLRPDGTLAVNHKGSAAMQHDYLGHYKKLGLYKDPNEAEVTSWKPAEAHQHVPIDQVDMPEIPHDWKVDKFQGLLAGPAAPKVGPVTLEKQPSGRYRVKDGVHRFGASYISGHSHVPAVIV